MPQRRPISLGTILGIASTLVVASLALAGPPDPATSTCTVTIVQGLCPAPACLGGAVKIARLCPLPNWDRVEFRVTVRDAAGIPCPNVNVKPAVRPGGNLDLWDGGTSGGFTNAAGEAVAIATGAHGCGRLGVCALDGLDSVFLQCEVEVRSPDVAGGPTPATCPFPSPGMMSFVNSSDVTNIACGFLVKFGPVGPNNACYDLNCNGFVNASDVNGTVCPPFGLNGGVLQHFGHGSGLGGPDTCP